MGQGSRARSTDEASQGEDFSDAPTRLGLPFADEDGPSHTRAREPAEVIALVGADSASEAGTAVLSSPKVSGRRRRRDRRTGDPARAQHRPEDRVGQVLSGTFRIERLIAVGGMGAVYEVAHLRLSQRFAVKFLDRGLHRDAEAYARFRQEAEIAAQVNHDNVVQVFDFNTDEFGSPYMVMELVAGETLDNLIRREAPLDRDEVLAIFEPLCRALDACHENGVVHRDLKPSNIMVFGHDDGRCELKLLDFGICKIKHEGAGKMTRENVVMGTPNYMSPEQASGHNSTLDARTDIFALGAILYEMLTGQKAFDAHGLPQLLHAIVYDEPTPLTEFGVPSRVSETVQAALAKDVDERTASVMELLTELQTAYRRPVDLLADAAVPTGRGGLGVGAWVFALLSSVVVAAGATYVLAVPGAHESMPSPIRRAEPESRVEPEPETPAGPPPFEAGLASSPAAQLVESNGRLYRADRSSLSYWADPNAEARAVVLPSAAPVTAMQLSTDRRDLWVGQRDGWVTRWDHALKHEPWRRDFGGGEISSIAAGSGYLAVAVGGTVRLLSTKTEKVLRTFKSGTDVDALLVTPGKRPLLMVFRGDEVELIDADQRRTLVKVPLGGAVRRVGLGDANVNGYPQIWTERAQGDWIVRRTYRIDRPSHKQPPRLEPVSTTRR